MGKYQIKDNVDFYESETRYNYNARMYIANELAEANRLKRLELKYYLVVNGMNAIEVKEDHNLEDKA